MSHKGKLLFVATVDKTALSVSYDSGHKVGYKRHRIEIRGREAGRGSNDMVMMEIWDVLLMGVRPNNISKDPLMLYISHSFFFCLFSK